LGKKYDKNLLKKNLEHKGCRDRQPTVAKSSSVAECQYQKAILELEINTD
jgi:hypothetical protein